MAPSNGPTFSVECGSPLLQFKLFDTSMVDHTANAVNLGITINEVAPTTPAQSPGAETLWNVVIDKAKLDTQPSGTAFVIAAVVIYQDLTKLPNVPAAWLTNV